MNCTQGESGQKKLSALSISHCIFFTATAKYFVIGNSSMRSLMQVLSYRGTFI